MIISNVIGGLGNQMFQYAAVRSLSIELGEPLLLDVSGFEGYALHQGFELQTVFNCKINIATKQDVKSILRWQYPLLFRRILVRSSFKRLRLNTFIVEPSFSYWSGVKNIPTNSYLTGYWQSEKYFVNITSAIRKDFTFKSFTNKKNIELSERITNVESVSLHIRRGDYASNPKTTSMHGLCSLEYYRNAIKNISEKLKRPHLFIFSDDIDWVKDNLKLNLPHEYVNNNQGSASYNDMHLMSLCKHHIIANSSFSWWGAWLNSSHEKIVIAPKKWFAYNIDTCDLLPDNWLRI